MRKVQTLNAIDSETAKKTIPDLQVFGDPDAWKVLCKASSKQCGFMKSTKAMVIPGVGCVIQVSTQQRNPDGSYSVAEAVTFVPGVIVRTWYPSNDSDEVIERDLVSADEFESDEEVLKTGEVEAVYNADSDEVEPPTDPIDPHIPEGDSGDETDPAE